MKKKLNKNTDARPSVKKQGLLFCIALLLLGCGSTEKLSQPDIRSLEIEGFRINSCFRKIEDIPKCLGKEYEIKNIHHSKHDGGHIELTTKNNTRLLKIELRGNEDRGGYNINTVALNINCSSRKEAKKLWCS